VLVLGLVLLGVVAVYVADDVSGGTAHRPGPSRPVRRWPCPAWCGTASTDWPTPASWSALRSPRCGPPRSPVTSCP